MPNFPCIACASEVRPRQQAIQCDTCLQWQHRTCNTGVTQEMYRRMVREEEQFDWQCTLCSIPNVEAPTITPPPAINTDVEAPDNQPVANNTDVEAPDNHPLANNTDVEAPDNPPANDTDAQEADNPLNNTSFNVSRSFIQPERIDELFVVDELPADPVSVEELEPVFTILDAVSQLGKGKLIPNGYSYTVKIKAQAKSDIFQSASAIVESVLVNNIDVQRPCEALPGTISLTRTANRVRAKLRPDEPRDLQFQVVKKPFVQLFSIHAFLREDDAMTQVPLVFILMSRRKTKRNVEGSPLGVRRTDQEARCEENVFPFGFRLTTVVGVHLRVT
ncbi:hypothetical protein LSAT2_004466 [Lamellibrachia satsuma]|nr:hypothetical protein LSAT2_004466 [Lamellibrachia satsuma]